MCVLKLQEAPGYLKRRKTENCPLLSCYAAVVLIYSQSTTNKMQHFSNIFISVRLYPRFRRFFASTITSTKLHIQRQAFVRPSDKCLTLYLQLCAPDGGRKKPSETWTASYRNKYI